MKKSDLTHLMSAATLFLACGVATTTAQSSPPPPRDGHPGAEHRVKMEARLGLNGDGQVDAAERAAGEAEMRARVAENPRMLARVDTDKDGQVSDAEWAVAKNKFQQNRHQEMKHRSANSHRRPDGHAPRKFDDRKGDVAAKEAFKHGWMMGKFDTNGDRKLDETERAAMRAATEAKKREQMEKHLVKLKSIDADGDGQISDAEWAKAKENFKQDHPGKRPHETAPDAKA